MGFRETVSGSIDQPITIVNGIAQDRISFLYSPVNWAADFMMFNGSVTVEPSGHDLVSGTLSDVFTSTIGGCKYTTPVSGTTTTA